MLSNPVKQFINGYDEEEFTYEGGRYLYHFSPYDNELSPHMECNVIFFADNEEHAKDVLKRMFLFMVETNEKYLKNKPEEKNHIKRVAKYKTWLDKIDTIKIELAPTNQFYLAGWADNYTVN